MGLSISLWIPPLWLVGVELGKITLAQARNRVGRVLRNWLGRGLPVHAWRASEEKERAESAKDRSLYDIAALTSDVALLGGPHQAISLGAKEALGIMTEDAPIGLHEALTDLRDASNQGDELRKLALRVRAHCPGAPPIPPSLQEVA